MKIPTLFKEYVWLIETIYRAGKITFAEINARWCEREESGGVAFARTTFNRHRDAIMDMFGIIIECDRKNGYRYFIYNRDVLRENSVANWMFSTLSVGNMLNENIGVQNRILIESIPSANEYLKRIIRAMRENRRIMMTYRRYRAASANSFSAAPYCVKLFKRRWYVLAKTNRPSYKSSRKGTMAVFALDRIENIALQKERFVIEPDFDAQEFFSECFGIVAGDGTALERIVVRAYDDEPYYMRDLPLHHSQQEIVSTADYTDFELYMRPTADFKGHMLSRGAWAEIIEPKWLALEMQNRHQDALNRYMKQIKK